MRNNKLISAATTRRGSWFCRDVSFDFIIQWVHRRKNHPRSRAILHPPLPFKNLGSKRIVSQLLLIRGFRCFIVRAVRFRSRRKLRSPFSIFRPSRLLPRGQKFLRAVPAENRTPRFNIGRAEIDKVLWSRNSIGSDPRIFSSYTGREMG